MHDSEKQPKLPVNYFLLIFVLTIPFWLIGGSKLPLPVNLPASALSFLVPSLAAAILCYRESGFAGVKNLIRRAWDHDRIKNKLWYLPALFLAPIVYLLSYVVMRLSGQPLPDPPIPLLMAPVFILMYLITGAGEELGWSGYAVEPVQKRWGEVRAGLILGVIWAVWHAVAFVQTGNSASWVIWQSLKTVAMRLLIVWLYNRSGKSVLAAILFHATDNVGWSLFPNYSSHYNPMVTGLMTWLTAGIVILGWRGKSPGRVRGAPASPD